MDFKFEPIYYTAVSKNDACFVSGQKWLENNPRDLDEFRVINLNPWLQTKNDALTNII